MTVLAIYLEILTNFFEILYPPLTPVKNFKNTYFEEYLCMAASKLTLRSHLKPSQLSNITKIAVAFQPML